MTAAERRPTPQFPKKIERIYMIGVCGTGMGSLAGMLRTIGYEVMGSDQNAYPPMSDLLAEQGIEIRKGWDAQNLLGLEIKPDLVVVGNVCRVDNPEVLAALELGLVSVSFPETLRELFLLKSKQRVVISGTHGKTTTSSLVAWFLEHAGHDPSFMIGGVAGNFGSNYKIGKGDIFVVEGDEYDSAYFDKVPKFWHYAPNTLAITNVEYDHADIYKNLEEIVEVFERLVEMLPPTGRIWANLKDANIRRVVKSAACSVHGFGVGTGVELKAQNLRFVEGGGAFFDVQRSATRLGTLESPLVGTHNIYNVLTALGVGLSFGLRFDQMAEALRTFKGVKKRQELIDTVDGIAIYDDFAHHPTAVRETVKAIRDRHPTARLWGIFEAKSNTSRRAVFQDDYPVALAGCDRVILSAPWKQDSLPSSDLIDLDRVVKDIEKTGTTARLIPGVDDIVATLVEELEPGDVVLGLSGSAFGGLHRKLAAALRQRQPAVAEVATPEAPAPVRRKPAIRETLPRRRVNVRRGRKPLGATKRGRRASGRRGRGRVAR